MFSFQLHHLKIFTFHINLFMQTITAQNRQPTSRTSRLPENLILKQSSASFLWIFFYCEQRMFNSPVAILDFHGNRLGGSSSSSFLLELRSMLPPTGQYCNIAFISSSISSSNNNNNNNNTLIYNLSAFYSQYLTLYFVLLSIIADWLNLIDIRDRSNILHSMLL